jgi:zinc D-Ala-D-Ala carboxypeptidase
MTSLRRTAVLSAVAAAGLVLLVGCGVAAASAPVTWPVGTGSAGVGLDDGAVPDRVTVDDELPAVTRLDPALRDALRAATADAARDGVGLVVNSGWRSEELQAQLLEDAVDDYGSIEEARRWVATAETSAHVSGDAVDIGPWDGADWLGEHGFAYGLCRTYLNEPWHFELRPEAVTTGCPRAYLDPTEDPRMQ